MNELKLTQEQAAFYKDIDVKSAVGDKLYPEFVYKGTTVRVLPYETCSADVVPMQDSMSKPENALAVRNIPGTSGLSAEAVLTKVVASAKAQYKSAEHSKHFVMHWAPDVTCWEVTTSSDTYTNLEACSPDGEMHMVLAATWDSTVVRIHLPNGRAGIRMTVDAPLRRDPIGISGIVHKALTHLEQGNFTHI